MYFAISRDIFEKDRIELGLAVTFGQPFLLDVAKKRREKMGDRIVASHQVSPSCVAYVAALTLLSGRLSGG